MLEKILLIKEQIDDLFIKYIIFIIIRKMKIPKNLILMI